MTAKSAKTGLDLLREPFPSHQIGKLPKPYRSDSPKSQCQECGTYHGQPALHLDFVGHAALTDRLLDADPQWTWEPVAFGPDGLPMLDRNGGLWIRLTVCGVTRLGYGDAQGKTGPNAIKEAIGDGLRNAGMRFGIALDLWHKGDLHIEEAGREEAKRQAERGPLPSSEDPWAGTPVRVPPDPEAVAKVKEQVAGCFDLKTLRAIRADVVAKAKTGEVAEPDAAELLTLIDECGQELRQKYEAEQAAAATSKAAS